jgi:hypothetical protein
MNDSRIQKSNYHCLRNFNIALFIYGSFNDHGSCSHYIVSNGRIINKQQTEKGEKKEFDVLSWNLSGRTEQNHKKKKTL